MTPTQYQSLVTTMRRVEAKVDAIEERLSFVYPTDQEMRVQIDAEVDEILGDRGIRVFADD